MHMAHSLVAIAEEQDSAPLGPSGNQEEMVVSHTSNLPPVEGVIGGDSSLHPDTNSPKEQPTHPIKHKATTVGPMDVAMRDEASGDDTDLMFRIRGLYRLLDLIDEQGSGGAGMIKAP